MLLASGTYMGEVVGLVSGSGMWGNCPFSVCRHWGQLPLLRMSACGATAPAPYVGMRGNCSCSVCRHGGQLSLLRMSVCGATAPAPYVGMGGNCPCSVCRYRVLA